MALGDSATETKYENYNPIFEEYNTSHSSPLGLNFDRGSDIEDAAPEGVDPDDEMKGLDRVKDIHKPLVKEVKSDGTVEYIAKPNYVNGFTNYKSEDAGIYHRGFGGTSRLKRIETTIRARHVRSATTAIANPKDGTRG